jgi:phosphoglycolate phosphatase-like HAD superfamily hydrolase
MSSVTYSIIFDLDGVLLDSESKMKWMKKALEDTLRYFHIKVTEDNLKKLDWKNLSKFPDVAAFFNINEKELWKMRNYHYKKRKIEAIQTKQISPFPDISAVSQLVDSSELAILSNSPQEVVDVFLKQFHLEKIFTAGVGRSDEYEDIFKLKPHPLLWKKLKPFLNGNTIFYVGDRATDKIFAKKMNIGFYGINRYENIFHPGYSSLHEIVKEIYKLIHKKSN